MHPFQPVEAPDWPNTGLLTANLTANSLALRRLRPRGFRGLTENEKLQRVLNTVRKSRRVCAGWNSIEGRFQIHREESKERETITDTERSINITAVRHNAAQSLVDEPFVLIGRIHIEPHNSPARNRLRLRHF